MCQNYVEFNEGMNVYEREECLVIYLVMSLFLFIKTNDMDTKSI